MQFPGPTCRCRMSLGLCSICSHAATVLHAQPAQLSSSVHTVLSSTLYTACTSSANSSSAHCSTVYSVYCSTAIHCTTVVLYTYNELHDCIYCIVPWLIVVVTSAGELHTTTIHCTTVCTVLLSICGLLALGTNGVFSRCMTGCTRCPQMISKAVHTVYSSTVYSSMQ